MRALLISLMVVLAGCAASVDPRWAQDAAARHERSTGTTGAADGLLQGIDPLGEPRIRLGDRALYRIALRDGESLEQDWLVRLRVAVATVLGRDGKPVVHTAVHVGAGEVPQPRVLKYRLFTPEDGDELRLRDYESHVSEVAMEIHKASGGLERESRVNISRRLLERGLVPACRPGAGLGARRRAELSLVAFLEIVRRDPVLRDVFWEVVRLPSLWSIAVELGVKVTLDVQFDAATRSEVQVAGRKTEVWDLPVRVLGNEQPMLLASFRLREPLSPYTMGAGVLSVSAVKPGDPDRTLTIQLLAAKREAPTKR